MEPKPADPTAQNSSAFVSKASVFRTTRWNVVRLAQEGHGDEAREGLERLARTYWYPLYAFARRQGLNEADAQDHTQSFLARLLTGAGLQSVDPSKGRFRSFLLACFKNFLADERQRSLGDQAWRWRRIRPFEPRCCRGTLLNRSRSNAIG